MYKPWPSQAGMSLVRFFEKKVCVQTMEQKEWRSKVSGRWGLEVVSDLKVVSDLWVCRSWWPFGGLLWRAGQTVCLTGNARDSQLELGLYVILQTVQKLFFESRDMFDIDYRLQAGLHCLYGKMELVFSNPASQNPWLDRGKQRPGHVEKCSGLCLCFFFFYFQCHGH